MYDLHEISNPARPRRYAGLGGITSGGNFGGVSTKPIPAQTEPNPTPLKPPWPSMSQNEYLQKNSIMRKMYTNQVIQPPTSAPGEQASESGKRRRRMRMSESLVAFISERKKRTEGGWPGEKSTAPGEASKNKPLDPVPTEQPKPTPTPSGGEEKPEPGSDWLSGKKKPKEIEKEYGDWMPDILKYQRQRYPKNPPHPPPWGGGPTRGNWRELSLIDAVLILQEMQGSNLFEKAKKKVAQELLVPSCEGVGYSKDINKSERGIGPTTPLVQSYESGGSKKKRAEGGLGGKLSQMGGGPGSENKNYGGPASSLGGKLSQILGGGGKAPGPSSTDKDIGGDAGGATGTAAGASGGASGGGEAGAAAAASGAAQGAGGGGGKEGSTSPVSSSLSPQIQGGMGTPPYGPTPTKTEGGKKKSAHSHRR